MSILVSLRVIIASVVAVSASMAHKFDTPGSTERALMLVQASARFQVRTSSEPPRMFVAEGCDGSTATLQHAINILALHGIDADDPSKNRENLIPEGNLFYNSKRGMMLAMKLMKDDLAKKGQALVFKSILHRDMELTTGASMLEMGTLMVYVTRKNQLDQLVCMIRDCFMTNKRYGQPVSGSGEPTNVCFDRRDANNWGEDNAVSDKAMLNVTYQYPSHLRSFLDENIVHLQEVTSSGYQELLKAGYSGPRLAYEDIMAFEKGGEGNVQTSLKQWQKLLEAWAVTPQMDKVRAYLDSKAGAWSQHSQWDEIYNYHEVQAELKRLHREDLLRD